MGSTVPTYILLETHQLEIISLLRALWNSKRELRRTASQDSTARANQSCPGVPSPKSETAPRFCLSSLQVGYNRCTTKPPLHLVSKMRELSRRESPTSPGSLSLIQIVVSDVHEHSELSCFNSAILNYEDPRLFRAQFHHCPKL